MLKPLFSTVAADVRSAERNGAVPPGHALRMIMSARGVATLRRGAGSRRPGRSRCARIEPMAEASLPDIRARSRPGIAIAAMMPMIATTISSSMRVKPLVSRIFMSGTPSRKYCPDPVVRILPPPD